MKENWDKFLSIYTDKSINGYIRGLAWVSTIAIIYIAGKTVYGAIFPPPQSQELANVQSDLAKFSAMYTPSYPDSAYSQYADAIYIAQNGGAGFDSNTIKNTLELMNNDLDVAKLIQAYGTRMDTTFGINTSAYTLFGASVFGINADTWGLFSSRLDDVNTNWKGKGITYVLQ